MHGDLAADWLAFVRWVAPLTRWQASQQRIDRMLWLLVARVAVDVSCGAGEKVARAGKVAAVQLADRRDGQSREFLVRTGF